MDVFVRREAKEKVGVLNLPRLNMRLASGLAWGTWTLFRLDIPIL